MIRRSSPPISDDPPLWAETLLRAVLPDRDRETISGDLLEEYRERRAATGAARAGLWYLRQTASFMTPHHLTRTLLRPPKENAMNVNPSRQSALWTAAGVAALVVAWTLLARSQFGPPVALEVAASLAVVLALAAASAMRSSTDWLVLARAGSTWGAAVFLVLLVRLAVETLAPVDPLDYFLAQARDDFSEFDFPRRWVPVVAGGAVLLAAGFRTAWRTGRVRAGIAVATTAAVLGSLAYAAVVAIANALPLAPIDVPSGLVPVLAMFATFIGAVGALLGRGAAAARQP